MNACLSENNGIIETYVGYEITVYKVIISDNKAHSCLKAYSIAAICLGIDSELNHKEESSAFWSLIRDQRLND